MIRKTLLAVLLFVALIPAGAESLVDSLENIPSVQTVYISPKMFRLLGVAQKDSLLSATSIERLQSMNIVVADNPSAITELTRETATYIHQNGYEEVECQSGNDENTVIYHKAASPYAVFIQCTESPSEYVVAVIQGNLSKDELKGFMHALPVEER